MPRDLESAVRRNILSSLRKADGRNVYILYIANHEQKEALTQTIDRLRLTGDVITMPDLLEDESKSPRLVITLTGEIIYGEATIKNYNPPLHHKLLNKRFLT